MAVYTNFFDGEASGVTAAKLTGPWASTMLDGACTQADMAVTQNSPQGLTVLVAAGSAIKSGYYIKSDAVATVSINGNVSGYNRIDLIVLDIDTTNKVSTFKAVQGTPSSSPVAPTPGALQLPLAQVLVANNASQIVNANITDVRAIAYPAINRVDEWVPAEAWTYASATTFTIPGDFTGKYQMGDKIKLTNGSVKYYYVISVAFAGGLTTVTVTGGSDYSLVGGTITANYFSKAENPTGFPQWFNWTPTYSCDASMTWTGITTAYAKFCIARRRLHFSLCALGTTGGVAAYLLKFTLPVTRVSTSGFVSGGGGCTQENGITKSGYVLLDNSTVGIVGKGDGSVWTLAANTGLYASGFCEI